MTVVSELTAVVKLDSAYARSHNRDMPGIDEILARLDLARKRGGFKSERAWCREAKASQSYIGAIRGRGGAKGTGEVKDVKRETMAKLAKAAGVDLGWMLGEGPREPVRMVAPTVVVPEAPARTNFDVALDELDWPDGITAAQAEEIRRRAVAEADGSATARTLPEKFWRTRLREIAAEVVADKSRVQRRA